MAAWMTVISGAMQTTNSLRQGHFLVVTAITLFGQLIANSSVRAEDEHLGITEYEIACMPCHGLEGRGDGPLAQNLKVTPADLTQIAKGNHGVFPASRMAEMIDGRAAVAGHLRREMPVWGDRYRTTTEPEESSAMVDQRARAQIDALVGYLESIQEK